MDTKINESFQKNNERVMYCIKYAYSLIDSSKLLFNDKKFNISYHLATLALEEIGKSVMLNFTFSISTFKENFSYLDKNSDDHAKKLFWALWTGSDMKREIFTNEHISQCKKLANDIHKNRLSCIYTDVNYNNPPLIIITESEAKKLIELTELRIKIAETFRPNEVDVDTFEPLEWFFDACDDKEKRGLIYGSKSLSMLSSLGNSNKWIKWLKEQFDEAGRLSEDLSVQEINRLIIPEKDGNIDKWKFNIKIYTLSHSIRPGVIKWWNSLSKKIKLNYCGNSEILIEFVLPKSINAQMFFNAAFWLSRRFLISLNIATRGYFWWYTPKDIGKFYNNLYDIESECKVDIEASPKLELNWNNKVLTQDDLSNTSLIMKYIPHPKDRDSFEPFAFYMEGISLLGKNDIHTRFEPRILSDFYYSLKSGIAHYNRIISPTNEDIAKLISSYFNSSPDIMEYLTLASDFENDKANRDVTLQDAGIMKIFCDVYFFNVFINLEKKNI